MTFTPLRTNHPELLSFALSPAPPVEGQPVRREREVNIMDMSKFGGRYLKAANVKQDGPFKATIVEVEEGKYDRPDLTLDDGSILSANNTSCQRMIHHWGVESDDWLDKEIEIYVDEVDVRDKQTGEMMKTDALFVRPVSPPLEKGKKALVKSRKDDFGADEPPH